MSNSETLKCNDCQKVLPDRKRGITELSSWRLGTYYEGPSICGKCSDKRYERAIIKQEAEAP